MFKKTTAYKIICDNCRKRITGRVFADKESAIGFCIINGLSDSNLDGLCFCSKECRQEFMNRLKESLEKWEKTN